MTTTTLIDGGYVEWFFDSSTFTVHAQKYSSGGTPTGPEYVGQGSSPQLVGLSNAGYVMLYGARNGGPSASMASANNESRTTSEPAKRPSDKSWSEFRVWGCGQHD